LGTVDNHTVYEAELVRMNLAMELLRQETQRVASATLGVDNQAALCSLEIKRSRPGHYLVKLLEHAVARVQRKRTSMHLQPYWTPGHIGIEGNEYVDGGAKWAAAGTSSTEHRLPKEFR
ncbi:hypothetical protein SCHPADRAFT_813065, partial [Schizopora paradoxa]